MLHVCSYLFIVVFQPHKMSGDQRDTSYQLDVWFYWRRNLLLKGRPSRQISTTTQQQQGWKWEMAPLGLSCTSSQFLQQREFDSEKERRAKNCNIYIFFIGRSLVHVRLYTSAKRSNRRWRSPLGILAASWAKAARTSRHSAAWFITTRASQTGTRVILQQGSHGHFSTKKIKNKKCQST